MNGYAAQEGFGPSAAQQAAQQAAYQQAAYQYAQAQNAAGLRSYYSFNVDPYAGGANPQAALYAQQVAAMQQQQMYGGSANGGFVAAPGGGYVATPQGGLMPRAPTMYGMAGAAQGAGKVFPQPWAILSL